jgi:hypothetical protein
MPLIPHAIGFPTCRYIKNKLTENEIKQATAKFMDEGEKSKRAENFKNKYESFDVRLKTFTVNVYSTHQNHVPSYIDTCYVQGTFLFHGLNILFGHSLRVVPSHVFLINEIIV